MPPDTATPPTDDVRLWTDVNVDGFSRDLAFAGAFRCAIGDSEDGRVYVQFVDKPTDAVHELELPIEAVQAIVHASKTAGVPFPRPKHPALPRRRKKRAFTSAVEDLVNMVYWGPDWPRNEDDE